MNAFKQSSEIELRGTRDLKVWLENVSNGHYVFTAKGELSKYLQETIGDFLFNDKKGKVWAAEAKIEQEDKHKNFFLETWSNLPPENKDIDRKNPGWLIKLITDILMYYFIKEKTLYLIDFRKLFAWAFLGNYKKGDKIIKGRIYDFPLKSQKKYTQLNNTVGHCVPIEIVKQEVGFIKLIFINGVFRKEKELIAASCPKGQTMSLFN